LFKAFKSLKSEAKEMMEPSLKDAWQRYGFEISIPEPLWRHYEEYLLSSVPESDREAQNAMIRHFGKINAFRLELKRAGWTPPEEEPNGQSNYPDYAARVRAKRGLVP
jgi:hypothetical protein